MSFFTEEEAREKWCPLDVHKGDGKDRCVASQCMAWRTMRVAVASDAYLSRIAADFRDGRKIDAIKALRNIAGIGLKEAKDRCEAGDYSNLTRTVGFCGAFGKVEP